MQIKHPCDWTNIYARRTLAVFGVIPLLIIMVVVSTIEGVLINFPHLCRAIKAQWERNDAV
ncbi:hypothetical protein [Aeromonas phage 85AhydR10PP]|nr:hypothetical protein [Aeromonas phage 85AhydR10PP]